MIWADKVCSNDDGGLTLTYFTAKSTFLSNAFYGEMLKLEFIETVEVYELKAEYIWVSEVKVIDFCLRSLRVILSKICPQVGWYVKVKFRVEPLWLGGQNLLNGVGHMAKMATIPSMVKSFKNFLWNQIENDDLWMIFNFFTERWDLLAGKKAWQLAHA